MAQPDQEQAIRPQRPQFSQPVRQISLMLIVLALSGFGAFMAAPSVMPVFQANPYLNGFIIFVFGIGVFACFYQVFQLIGSVRWIENFAAGNPDADAAPPPLLAPLAALLRQRGARMQVSSSSTRSILESVSARIDEAREITRYIVNMLIFLGLLGTFYGLATTVPAVVDTIRSLAPQDGEGGVDVFNRLMTGLEAQLGGMGVAFASSLLGLAGSLVVGLLELFAGHGQNRFYQELEDWLSSITRLGFSSGEEGGSTSAVVEGVLDHMAEQMDALQDMLRRTDASRSDTDTRLQQLSLAVEKLANRADGRDTHGTALAKVAEGQDRLITAIEGTLGGEGIDAESRMRLRSIDVQMLRILEEISAGRQESMAELRQDISQLTKVLTRPARGEPRRMRRPQNGDKEG